MGVGGGTSTSKCDRGLPVGVDGSMLRKMTSAYHGVVWSSPLGRARVVPAAYERGLFPTKGVAAR